jgi:hypothetical protein
MNESNDKGTVICVKDRIQTEGLSTEQIHTEGKNKISLFVSEALRRYQSYGLTFVNGVITANGHILISFDLPKSDHALDLSKQLSDFWIKFR